ncbi:MAG: large subunit ribosomal protein L13 [Myxococcota bacterium]|jgi:large subunit ribosomal protein L13
MNTTITKPQEVQHGWYVIDAEGQTLGRLATRIATALRGKHKPTFNQHLDCGDYVVVLNAEKIVLSGKKLDNKHYYRYSGHPGGLKATSARTMLEKHPERVITFAVKGMLPKNRLARQVLKKLRVYAGAEHPHAGQDPQPFPEHI